MKINLAKAFIERGIINLNTKIVAKCPVLAMGNVPTDMDLLLTINGIVVNDEKVTFKSVHRSGRHYNVPCEMVSAIDGMAPDRLAEAFEINTGTPKLKRGRKPKNVLQDV